MTTDGTWTYTYDDAGQATGKSKSGTAWTYEYDLRGQLVEASDGTTTVTYAYDAFGNRIARSEDDGIAVAEERYVLDGWDTAKPGAVGTENFDVAMDLDGDDDIIVRRLFGPGFDDLIGGQDGGGTVRWYGTDHLGSVWKVFDNSGTVTNTVDYDAFGGFFGGVPVDRYAYTGREWDATTGLTHYRAREKDGHRFLTEDPMGFGAGDANPIRYSRNEPINVTDPSGLWTADGVKAIIGSKDPLMLKWLDTPPRAILHPSGDSDYSYRKNRLYGEEKYEWQKGIATATMPSSWSDERAAAELMKQFQYGGEFWLEYKKWVLGQLANLKMNACTVSEYYNKGLLGDMGRVTLEGANLVLMVYTFSTGGGAADVLIRASEGELSIWDATYVLPLVGKILDKVAGKIHIVDKAGNVHSFDSNKLKELREAGAGEWKKAGRSASKRATELTKEFGLDNIPATGKNLPRELQPHEIMAISEHAGVEFSQVVLKNGEVKLFKGSKGEVSTLLTEKQWSNVKYRMHSHPGDLNVWISAADIKGCKDKKIGMEVLVRDYQTGRSLRIQWTYEDIVKYENSTAYFRNVIIFEKLQNLGVNRMPPLPK